MNLTDKYIAAAKRVFRYLKSTKYYGIWTETGLYEYADIVYEDDKDNKRLIVGYLYKFGGGPVMWKSGRQPIITLLLTEAEYMMLIIIVKEAAVL